MVDGQMRSKGCELARGGRERYRYDGISQNQGWGTGRKLGGFHLPSAGLEMPREAGREWNGGEKEEKS